MKKNKTGSLIRIYLGITLIVAAAGLTVYNMWDDNRASAASDHVLQMFNEIRMWQNDAEQAEVRSDADDPDGSDAENAVPGEMPTIEVDGYRYIGTIAIFTLNVELPIMEEWDYTRMKISPCRYSGSLYEDDLVVCAHNYSRHFGRLDNLQINDDVIVTDALGNVFLYQVAEIETLPGTAVEEMSAGDWDLTLFTCTYSGRARVTVRCKRYSLE